MIVIGFDKRGHFAHNIEQAFQACTSSTIAHNIDLILKLYIVLLSLSASK
jgi:hypothetical protein